MKMRMQTFGEIEVEGERYDDDLVIEQGEIRKRRKKPSKAYRARFGHTPLSAEEAIPWHGRIRIGRARGDSARRVRDVRPASTWP